MTHYSRPLTINASNLAAGDLVDLSVNGDTSYWAEITGVDVIACQDDENEDDRDEPCEGSCHRVLSLKAEEDGDLTTWHVQPYEATGVRARLLADATDADVEAENEAHVAAAIARNRVAA